MSDEVIRRLRDVAQDLLNLRSALRYQFDIDGYSAQTIGSRLTRMADEIDDAVKKLRKET